MRSLRAAATISVAIGLLGTFATIAGAASSADPKAVKIYVAYADDLHNTNRALPSPWVGSPGVIFIGTGSPWDAGAIRLDNPSANPLTVDSVSIDIGSATGINPWSALTPFVIPGKGTAILTQTTQFNLDTDDGCSRTGPFCFSQDGTYSPPASCSTPSNVIPLVHVTVGARNPLARTYVDQDQVLTTSGVDGADCLPGGNESHNWERARQLGQAN